MYQKMGASSSKVYELEDQIVALQREVKQLKEKMGKPTDTVEKLEKDMIKQKQLTFQLDGFARVTSDELFKPVRPRTYDWR
jgi:flagellar biosynthesis chaperone FliJ